MPSTDEKIVYAFHILNVFLNAQTGKAFIDLITQYGWESITILYENNDSMMRLKEIFDITSEVKARTFLLPFFCFSGITFL
jgi:hypothetical protein